MFLHETERGLPPPPPTNVKPLLGLQEDEQVVWSGKPVRMGYLGHYIRSIVGGIIFWFLFGSWFFLYGDFAGWFGWLFGVVFPVLMVVGGVLTVEVRIRANKYFITNKRFLREFTFLSRHTEAVSMDLVTDINCNQGILQRAVNCGNVYILTAGTAAGFKRGGFPGFKFEALYNPIEITQIASRVRTQYKKNN